MNQQSTARLTHIAVAEALDAGCQFTADIASHCRIGNTTADTSLRALVNKGLVRRELKAVSNRSRYTLLVPIADVHLAFERAQRAEGGPWSAVELMRAWPARIEREMSQ